MQMLSRNVSYQHRFGWTGPTTVSKNSTSLKQGLSQGLCCHLDCMSAPEASNPPTTEASLSSDAPNPENATIPPVPASEDKPTPEREAPTTPLPSDDALLAALRDILKGVDFHTVTQGQVRAKLEEHFGQDLSEKKAFIRENLPGLLKIEAACARQTVQIVRESRKTRALEACGAASDETDPPAKKKGRGMFGKELLLSPGLAEFMGETHMSRSEVRLVCMHLYLLNFLSLRFAHWTPCCLAGCSVHLARGTAAVFYC
jgi:hypothetical protein